MFFDSLDFYSKIFLGIAVASTVVFLGRFILMLTIGDHDVFGSFDDGVEISPEGVFAILSFQTISAFLMSFGWLGLIAKAKWHLSLAVSIILAMIFGLLMMFLIAYLLMQMKKLNKIVKFDINKAVGSSGKAYTDLVLGKTGQVQVVISGKLMTLNAVTKSNEVIPAFSQVVVTHIENNTLVVAEYKGE